MPEEVSMAVSDDVCPPSALEVPIVGNGVTDIDVERLGV